MLASLHFSKNIARRGIARFGFTLIELLVVMVIIVLLAAFAVPAASSIFRGSAITQSGDIISGQLSLARQMALSRNRQMEVRIYRYADPEIPGEVPATPATGKYRAIQTFEILDSGTARALGKLQRLPGNTIIDSGKALSSIIGNATTTTTPNLSSGSTLKVPLSRAGLNYDSVSFRFMPDGSTNLPPQTSSTLWFLTMHKYNTNNDDNLPDVKSVPNFLTVQINPPNGKIRTFHP